MIALVGGTILTVTRGVVKDGVVLVGDDGRIRAVGRGVKVPDDAEVMEVKGMVVTPGFIDAHSHLGVIPEGLDWEYADVNDYYSPVTACFKAIDALDPYDEGFRDAVEGGVTMVYTGPSSANVIGGIGAIVWTYGDGLNDMLVRAEAGLKMATGRKRPREAKSKQPYPTTNMGTMALMRRYFALARRLLEGGLEEDKIDGEERMMVEAVARVLRGEMPARIHISTSPHEILSVIRLIDEYKFRATLDHAFGSHLIADEIARRRIPVIYGPPMITRFTAALRYVSDETPARLAGRGVEVSLMTDHPVIPQRHLRLLAAVAVRNGMSLDDALKAITINPARAIGVGDIAGSVEPGKYADLVVASDHPVKPYARIEMVLVRGKVTYERR